MYPSISFLDKSFKTKVISELKENGLVVINDVISDRDCDKLVDGIVNKFRLLCPELKTSGSDLWQDEHLVSQTRPGLFQSSVSNLEEVWTVRSNDNIRSIFEHIYSEFRSYPVSDFIVSGDGINVRANVNPVHTKDSKDWAHVDQTSRDDIYKCFQGQAVLTNTTASFVATPKSHLIFDELLEELGTSVNYKTQWLKFDNKQIKIAQSLLGKLIHKNNNKENKHDFMQWQVPILSKKGSFIIWLSSTIHSAKLQDRIDKPKDDDKYFGWRCVIYVCYRPKEEFSESELCLRQQVFDENLTTNHWATTVFPKMRYTAKMVTFHLDIIDIIKNPDKIYEKVGKPKLNEKQLKLLGY